MDYESAALTAELRAQAFLFHSITAMTPNVTGAGYGRVDMVRRNECTTKPSGSSKRGRWRPHTATELHGIGDYDYRNCDAHRRRATCRENRQ
jgi:hypothetical protein